MNIITATDSYKLGHWGQYPANTKGVYSYFEFRTGARYDEAVFFGLQPLLEVLEKGVTLEDVNEAYYLSQAIHGRDDVFNLQGWLYIVNELDGKLPVRIKAVPEGTVVPIDNVLMTVENLDSKCFWLTNALESFLTHVWYTSTVATLSRDIKKTITRYLDETGGSKEALPFMLHDFGYRGATSHESAAAGGAAHLVNFLGTDTIPALQYLIKHYSADISKPIGLSVPATEHSVMTAEGKLGEAKQVQRLLDGNPTGVVSCVIDSYDPYKFVDELVCWRFKEQIMARDGKFVVRPDSTTPTHKTKAELVVALLNSLHGSYPGPDNEKGYKTLDPHVGILYGDGLVYNEHRNEIEEILIAMQVAGFAADQIVFGMGGGLHQGVTRDTQRSAFKCAGRLANGVWVPIQKNPLDQSKKSKAGRLQLVTDDERIGKGLYSTISEDSTGPSPDQLQTVFENGSITKRYTLDEVRERAAL